MSLVKMPYFNDEERGKKTNEESDRHHRLAKSQGGNNHEDNILRMYKRMHVANHMLFANALFAQKVMRLLEMDGPAVTNNLKEDILELFEGKDLDYFYNDHVIKNGKK